jgi:iron complex transport system ATP-binding protein
MTVESLSAREVGFAVGGRALLRDVSLEIVPGRVTMLIGPNGAGKSTLLRIMAGEVRATRGSVRLDGADIARLAPEALARRRALLPQQSHLQLPFTVAEVVAFGRHIHREPRAHTREVCAEAMRRLGIVALAARVYPTLSGGEQTRTQLARVLAQLIHTGPGAAAAARYLLLDEPAASLDVQYQHQLCGIVREFAHDQRTAVLMTVHDLNLAAQYADEVVVLNGGAVVARGPAAVIVDEPQIAPWFHVRLATTSLATGEAARRTAATIAKHGCNVT